MSVTLTRIASHGQINPVPFPETAHLTPEERAEYTFLLNNNGELSYVTEKSVREISPIIEHMSVGNVFLVSN